MVRKCFLFGAIILSAVSWSVGLRAAEAQPRTLAGGHAGLFPTELTEETAKIRREEFERRTGQAFRTNPEQRERVVKSLEVQQFIDIVSGLGEGWIENLTAWYQEAAPSLDRDQVRAVSFVGTFFLEVLALNLRSDSGIRPRVVELWELHKESVLSHVESGALRSFAIRIGLTLPDCFSFKGVRFGAELTNATHSDLRFNAFLAFYLHYQERLLINEPNNNIAGRFYAEIVDQDDPGCCDSFQHPRTDAWFDDVATTVNMSRAFHRQFFGDAVRGDLPLVGPS